MNTHRKMLYDLPDSALQGIVDQLTRSGDWPSRLQAAQAELERRRSKRRNPSAR